MRFLRYALGEIVLVVIGILIALQIHNWNAERIERVQIREYARNLADAIERDMKMLDPVELQIRAAIRQAEELAGYVRGRKMEELDNAEMYFLTSLTGYRPYAWDRAALEQLKGAGGLRKMKNALLVQRISEYDALTLHLDQDYREDEQNARAIREAVLRLVDTNYDVEIVAEATDWNDGFTQEDIERRLTGFRETAAFRKMAALRRPLLSNDLVEFRRLANRSLQYADSASARPEIELPRLRRFAAEIQGWIDEEYR